MRRRTVLAAVCSSLAAAGGLATAAPAEALNCAAFENAIANASNGDVITLDAGLTCNDAYDLAYQPAPFSVTIQGAGNGATLDGTGLNDSILDVPGTGAGQVRLTIRNLTFRNGLEPTGNGAAILAGAGDLGLTVDNSRFFGNRAPMGFGGAVAVQSSVNSEPLIIKNSVFGDGTAAGANSAQAIGALDVLAFDQGGPVVVSNNTFNGNSATTDIGAASITANGEGNPTTTIENNRFIGNTAGRSEAGALATSGQIVALRGNTFTNNRLANTTSDSAVGGAFTANGGIGSYTLEQVGNRFVGNRITRGSQADFDAGGGGEWTRGYKLTSRSDRFVRNSIPAAAGPGEAEGGGLGIEGCTGGGAGVTAARVENLVAAGNSAGAGGEGAGVYAGGCVNGPVNLTMVNSTVAGNSTSGPGAVAGLFGGADDALTLRNSIVAGNSGGTDFGGFGAGRTAKRSDVCAPAVLPGAGNICKNPKLAGAATGNVHQTFTSPTLNRGADGFVPPLLTTDFEGNRRILGKRVDMGADEYKDPFRGVKIVSKTVTVKNGVARVRLRCAANVPGPCRGTLRLVRPAKKGVKKLKLGSHEFSIKRGKAVAVPVELPDKGLAELAQKGSLHARARATALDRIDTKRTSSRKLKLKA